jgi:hypothetical protein
MTTDERPPDDDRWFTYVDAAERLGISPEAVRAICRREKWPRRRPNKIGEPVHVLVPENRLANGPPTVVASGQSDDDQRSGAVTANGHDRGYDRGLSDVVRLFEGQLDALRRESGMQIDRERARADAAEHRIAALLDEQGKLTTLLTEERAEHRQVVAELIARIPARRSWWLWRRR